MKKYQFSILLVLTLVLGLFLTSCNIKFHEHQVIIHESVEATCSTKGSIKYYECLDLTISLNTNGNDGCEKGSSVWIGKYSLKDNIITITDMKVDKNDSYNPTGILNGPSEKLIVNFDNMYMCDRDKGLDCDMPFEKK